MCWGSIPVSHLDERERIRGALLGMAVGDALGAPLEGMPPVAAAAVVARGLEMTGGGSWAPGEWTDDTAMALELAASIAACGVIDIDDLSRRYIAWATADGKGIGRATRAALVGARDAEDSRARARLHHETGGLAAGNGTVMRVAPIGLAARNLAEAVDAAERDSQLTHADPAATVASSALCAAFLALRETVDPLAAARAQAQADPRVASALSAVDARNETALARLAGGPEAGACWTTLALALYALTAIDHYGRGVTWAISRGGDTDTNAAVAGALLGYRHGPEAIPAPWITPLRDRDRIEHVAEDLFRGRR